MTAVVVVLVVPPSKPVLCTTSSLQTVQPEMGTRSHLKEYQRERVRFVQRARVSSEKRARAAPHQTTQKTRQLKHKTDRSQTLKQKHCIFLQWQI